MIDSGARANAITPAYCRQHKLKVRPVNELATNPTLIPVSGIGGFTQALGYAIINVRIEGIGSYNEEQVVLVDRRRLRIRNEGTSNTGHANNS